MGEVSSLLEWLGKQPDWAKDALRRHARSPNFELNEEEKASVIARVRHAAGIASDADLTHEPLTAEHLGEKVAAKPRALLCSLGPVAHIGRLAAEQKLSFALDGVTLVYGDNGSGKSGYCRITKKICRSLTTDELLGNVFEAGDKPKAEVVIRYQLEGAESPTEHNWTDGTPPPEEVRSMSVFDSGNARLYVDRENRIGFLPTEIALLERHGTHCGLMDAEFQREKKALDQKLKVPLPGGFIPSGTIDKVLKSLLPGKPVPTVDSLTALAVWGTEAEDELQALENSLREDAAALATRSKRSEAALQGYHAALTASEAGLGEEAATALKVKRDASEAAKAAAAAAAESAFDGEPLIGVGGGPWRLMYDHARAYIASIGQGDELRSDEGDLCALCQEPMSAAASDRIKRFQEFLSRQTTSAATEAASQLAAAIAAIEGVALPARATVELALSEFASISAEREAFAVELATYVEAAGVRKAALAGAGTSGEFSAIAALPPSVSTRVTAEIEKLRAEGEAYADGAKLDQERAKKVTRLNELKDQKQLNATFETILARRNDLERHSQIAACIKSVATQSISSLITKIRRQLVTEGLEKRISHEIEALDLAHIPFSVIDKSQDGGSFFEVTLDASVKTPNNKVLSEGEQRALALACFLAEAGGDTSKNGLIIDDPVSSLDHLRIRKVAERLVSEAAKGKQIVVFTHNILFYNEVISAAAAASPPIPLARRMISKSSAKGFGIITEDDEPWVAQKVNDRITRLRQRLKELQAFEDFQNEEYRRAVTDYYASLRETWERLVEEMLLGKVVERFGSEVKTQSLKLVEVSDPDYKTIFWAMKRVSERSGHDMAGGKNIPLPKPDEAKADLEAIDAYRLDLRKRTDELSKRRKALEEPPPARTA